MTNFTVAYTLIFSFLVCLTLLPRINVLERQIRQRQSLLLLLPQELISGFAPVRELVMDVLAEAEAGEVGAASARAAASKAAASQLQRGSNMQHGASRRFSVMAGMS